MPRAYDPAVKTAQEVSRGMVQQGSGAKEYDPDPEPNIFTGTRQGVQMLDRFGRPGTGTEDLGMDIPPDTTPQMNPGDVYLQPASEQKPASHMLAADAALDLTTQEKFLYQHHLDNLGKGGVKNPDGTTSSFLGITVGVGDKTYVLPTVWNNKIVPNDEAIKNSEAAGLDKFPSYPTQPVAFDRYMAIHEYMNMDTMDATKK